MENTFANARTLAHAIRDIAGTPLTPRPYNRFEPDDTIWWLVPSTEWPAYKFGKLFFNSRLGEIPGGEDGIYCGFYIEKGLTPVVKEFYHHSLIMDGGWLWNDFIGKLPQNLPALNANLILTITAHYLPPEKADFLDSPESFFAQKESFEEAQASFKVGTDLRIRLLEQNLNPRNQDILHHFDKNLITVSEIADLAQSLLRFPQSDWIWIDFYTGIVIQRNSSRITPARLWKQYLEPWSSWLRKA